MTADADSRAALMSMWVRVFRRLGKRERHLLRRSFHHGAALFRRLEGPLDRCGLAFFLSSKFTNVLTMLLATKMSKQLPVSSWSSWGETVLLQDASLLACTSMLNVAFVPRPSKKIPFGTRYPCISVPRSTLFISSNGQQLLLGGKSIET